jgi:hypothetical protein
MRRVLTKIYHKLLYNKFQVLNQNIELLKWKFNKENIHTPHIIKQRHIRQISQKFNLSTLVETGTYKGDMVQAQLSNFNRIYSIELSEALWQKACIRFIKSPHIKILKGDSGSVLESVVPNLDTSTLFWLDGHYSAGITAKGELNCPVYKELSHIFNSSLDHFIIIDDARLFIGKDDYPTMQELNDFVLKYKSEAIISVEDDLIFINPNN